MTIRIIKHTSVIKLDTFTFFIRIKISSRCPVEVAPAKK